MASIDNTFSSGYGLNPGASFQGIVNQYSNLGNQVQNTIAGIGKTQNDAINRQYVAEQGKADQGLIDRGLGNTTVTSAVNRGLTYDKRQSQNALQSQLAQLSAGYQSQLGLSSLGFQGQYMNQQNAYSQQSAMAAQQAALRGYGGGGGQITPPGPFGTNGGFGSGSNPYMAQNNYGSQYGGVGNTGSAGSSSFYNQYLIPQSNPNITQYVGNQNTGSDFDGYGFGES